MSDFKKITQMIKANPRDRYVIVEKGEPAWVVLSMADYENLVSLVESRQVKETESERDQNKEVEEKIDEAMVSYQQELEKEEAVYCEKEEKKEEKKKSTPFEEPELYFEKEKDLSTGLESEEEIEFNNIPF